MHTELALFQGKNARMPIHYKIVSVKEPDKFTCDKCHKIYEMHTCVRIKHTFGYDSPPGWDMTSVDISLCEACLINISTSMKIIRCQSDDHTEHKSTDRLSHVLECPGLFSNELPDFDLHPDNGKNGYWKVIGIRHQALVQTDSAKKARELAVNIVGDWELESIEYLGPHLPKVMNFI
ncbi:hypothetical protein [Zooshikella harenae]|uniref:HNH endonuclease n=1 Tax=Zooshikella harenae TaxID=2827238 RepID=A0ABS5ZJ27_9GAMM|nr:hypothetical protein [Zooshikella harenae]MBU2713893.1 hypothetical protein [Zooshikella harenae]